MNYHRANSPEDGDAKTGSMVPAAQYVPATRDPYSSPYNSAVGTYLDPGAGAASDFRIDLFEYLRIFYKRRWLILSIVGAALVFGALTTLMKTPLYTSTIRLQIDRSVAKIVESGNITPIEGTDIEFMRTQYELLDGPTMAERVASALKLGEEGDFFKARQFSIFGFLKKLLGFGAAPAVQASISNKANLEAAAAGVVLGNRAVIPIVGSRLVDINYSDRFQPARKEWRRLLQMRSLLQI